MDQTEIFEPAFPSSSDVLIHHVDLELEHLLLHIGGVVLKLGVPGYPKWMVDFRENPMNKMDDDWGNYLYLRKPPYLIINLMNNHIFEWIRTGGTPMT